MKFKDRPKSASTFLKIAPGESIKGVFRGDPYDFYQHWLNQKGSLCTEEKGCDSCKNGKKKAFRFRINFLINEEGNYVSKIFEQGGATYDYLKSLSTECPLEKTAVKISREGEGLKTKYTIIPLPTLNEETQKKLEIIPLQDLTNFGNNESELDHETSVGNDDIPF